MHFEEEGDWDKHSAAVKLYFRYIDSVKSFQFNKLYYQTNGTQISDTTANTAENHFIRLNTKWLDNETAIFLSKFLNLSKFEQLAGNGYVHSTACFRLNLV